MKKAIIIILLWVSSYTIGKNMFNYKIGDSVKVFVERQSGWMYDYWLETYIISDTMEYQGNTYTKFIDENWYYYDSTNDILNSLNRDMEHTELSFNTSDGESILFDCFYGYNYTFHKRAEGYYLGNTRNYYRLHFPGSQFYCYAYAVIVEGIGPVLGYSSCSNSMFFDFVVQIKSGDIVTPETIAYLTWRGDAPDSVTTDEISPLELVCEAVPHSFLAENVIAELLVYDSAGNRKDSVILPTQGHDFYTSYTPDIEIVAGDVIQVHFEGYGKGFNKNPVRWPVGGKHSITVVNPLVVGVKPYENNIRSYTLTQNYPNPFNPVTKISYSVKEAGVVNLVVYNQLGEIVTKLVNEYKSAGEHSASFDGSNLPSGIYFYKLTVNEYSETRKMVLLK